MEASDHTICCRQFWNQAEIPGKQSTTAKQRPCMLQLPCNRQGLPQRRTWWSSRVVGLPPCLPKAGRPASLRNSTGAEIAGKITLPMSPSLQARSRQLEIWSPEIWSDSRSGTFVRLSCEDRCSPEHCLTLCTGGTTGVIGQANDIDCVIDSGSGIP